MKKIFILMAVALSALTFSCRRSNSWEIKGHIENAPEATVVLESSFNGNWFPIDSVKTGNDGKFTLSHEASQFPSIYRLSFNGKKAYFPVDSIDRLTFEANAGSFDNGYTVTGTPGAEMLSKVNKMISEAGSNAGNNEDLKRSLSELVLEDPAGITAYYVINSSTATGNPIFSPSNRGDLRIIGAVANAYIEQRPNDPRTAYLKNLYLGARRATLDRSNLPVDTLVATEILLPEISLLDDTGVNRSLTEVVAGRPVLVNFTVYNSDYSPALNVELAKIYDLYSSKGLEIYQIAFDDDEFQWRQSAKNLPWITVFNSPKEGFTNLVKYNVDRLPMTFIINRNGELVERVEDPSKIASALARYM